MKKTARKLLVIFLVLLATGIAKLPFEQKLAGELRARGLIQAPLDLDTRTKLGQTTYAVALGGLRSLVAALLNLRAYVHFEYQEWFELEDAYRTITTLQPRTPYYWNEGFSHLAYDAYADYRDKPGIPEARRRLRQKEFLARGLAMLKEGIRNNPDDWHLRRALGRLLSNPYKPQDLPAAAAAYAEAIECPGAPRNSLARQRLYILVRMPNRRAETWKTVQEVWTTPENRIYPSVQSIFFTLQFAHLPATERLGLEEIYGSRAKALRNLSWYWKRRREGFPMAGVRESLELLIKEFQVPDAYNPLLNRNWHGFPRKFLEY